MESEKSKQLKKDIEWCRSQIFYYQKKDSLIITLGAISSIFVIGGLIGLLSELIFNSRPDFMLMKIIAIIICLLSPISAIALIKDKQRIQIIEEYYQQMEAKEYELDRLQRKSIY